MYRSESLSSTDKKEMSCTWLTFCEFHVPVMQDGVSTVTGSTISTVILNNLIQMWLQTTKINAFNRIQSYPQINIFYSKTI